jgi:hypothetical protein
MPESPKKPAASRAGGWPAAIVALFVVVAIAALYLLRDAGKGGRIELGTSGVSIDVRPSDRLEDLIARAATEEPRVFRALLAERDIYSVADPRLVARLRDGDLPHEVRAGLQQLLYDLSGPFALPDTFRGASGALIEAVAELERQVRDFEIDDPDALANPFFVELWIHQLNQAGVFGPHVFNANATKIEISDPPQDDVFVVYVCANSDLVDRDMQLALAEPDRPSALIDVEPRIDLFRFNCTDPAQTLSRYLARHTARLGLPTETFSRLYGPVEEGATLPPRARALFQLSPRNYRPAAPVLPASLAEEM